MWTDWINVPTLRLGDEDAVYENNRYQVRVSEFASRITHLSIKRLNKAHVHDWRELLRIKNELTHPNREAVEIYPGMFRVVDTVNQYHLWVLPLGVGLNLGFIEPHVDDSAPDSFVPHQPRQRPLPAWMPRHKGDGSIIARIATGSDGKGGLQLTFPLFKEEA